MAEAITAYSQTKPTDATASKNVQYIPVDSPVAQSLNLAVGGGGQIRGGVTYIGTPAQNLETIYVSPKGERLVSPTLTQQQAQDQAAAQEHAIRVAMGEAELAAKGVKISSAPSTIRYGEATAQVTGPAVATQAIVTPKALSPTPAVEGFEIKGNPLTGAPTEIVSGYGTLEVPVGRSPFVTQQFETVSKSAEAFVPPYVPAPIKPAFAQYYVETGRLPEPEKEAVFERFVAPIKSSFAGGTQAGLGVSRQAATPKLEPGFWHVDQKGKLLDFSVQAERQTPYVLKAFELPTSNVVGAQYVAGAAVLVTPAVLGETVAASLGAESLLAGAYGGAASFSTKFIAEGGTLATSLFEAGKEAGATALGWAAFGKLGGLIEAKAEAKAATSPFVRTTSQVKALSELEVGGQKYVLASGESLSFYDKSITKAVYPLAETTGIKIVSREIQATSVKPAGEIVFAEARGTSKTLSKGLFGIVESKPIVVEAFSISEETKFIQSELQQGKPFYRSEISAGTGARFETGKAVSTEVFAEYGYVGRAGGKSFKYAAVDLEKAGAVKPVFFESRGTIGKTGFSEQLAFVSKPQKIEPLESYRVAFKRPQFELATFSGVKVQPYALAQPITKGAGLEPFQLAKPYSIKAPKAISKELGTTRALTTETEKELGGETIAKQMQQTQQRQKAFTLQTDVTKGYTELKLRTATRATSLYGATATKVIGVKQGKTQLITSYAQPAQANRARATQTYKPVQEYGGKAREITSSSFKIESNFKNAFKLSTSTAESEVSKQIERSISSQKPKTIQAQTPLTSTAFRSTQLTRQVVSPKFSTKSIEVTFPISKTKVEKKSAFKLKPKQTFAFKSGKTFSAKQGVTVDYLSGFLTQLQTGKSTTPTGAKAVSRFREQALRGQQIFKSQELYTKKAKYPSTKL